MIDRVICLGIDKRSKDFWPALREDCLQCTGLPLDIFVAGDGKDASLTYDHIDHPYHTIMNQYVGYSPRDRVHINFNIFMCHKKILLQAIERNENILLIEDDAKFIIDRWHEVWLSNKLQDFFTGNAWDALFVGYFQRQYDGDKVYGESGECAWREHRIISIKRAQSKVPGRISGLHGIILNKSFILTLYNECNRSPLDGFINSNLDRFRIFYIEPQLIGCLSNFSYCEGSQINRERFWE